MKTGGPAEIAAMDFLEAWATEARRVEGQE